MFKRLALTLLFAGALTGTALAYSHPIFGSGTSFKTYDQGGMSMAMADAEDQAQRSLYNMCINGEVFNARVTNRNCFSTGQGGGSCTISMQAECAQ